MHIVIDTFDTGQGKKSTKGRKKKTDSAKISETIKQTNNYTL